MFLKSLSLTDFRSLHQVDVRFDKAARPLALFLGDNGVGKSSLLKAVALVTAGSDALAELVDDVDTWIRQDCKSARILAELSTSDSQIREVSIEFARGEGLSQFLHRNREALQALDAALAHSSRNYFVAGVGASRRLSRDLLGRNTSRYRHVRAQSVATLFDPDATLKSLESWAMEMDYRNGPGLVSDVLGDLLPGLSFEGIDKERGQLLFRTPDGVLPLGQLSEGFQNMCAWVGDLSHRLTTAFENYASPLDARGLILIDEIELHLHPKWQRRLLDFLRRRLPNFQILATTHSPLAAQQTQDHELFMLQREPSGVVVLEEFQGNASSLLLSQIVTSPAFGLETDASRETESSRRRYLELRDKERGPEEQEEFTKLIEFFEERPEGGRSNMLLSETQLAFLSRLERSL